VRNPYVTGPFVTGRKHYGRKDLIDYLLHGANHACWVTGNRRIGKTSLLRQLELLALAEPTLVPVVWDMQGSDSYRRLGQYLTDAANECRSRLEMLGIAPAALGEEDPAVLLSTLRRAAARAGWELLLLCDETEVLIKIARAEPAAMQRLHRELTAGAGLRVVAASTQAIYAMHDVCRGWPTSSFLAGFDMSQVLSGLTRHSAAALITQAQNTDPVRAAPELIAAISDRTNNHPYFMQLLCARLFQEDGWLRPLSEADLEVDAVLRGLIEVDYYSLTVPDRHILRTVQHGGALDEAALIQASGYAPGEARLRIHNLGRLGYLRRNGGGFAIGNHFLANWLATEPDRSDEASPEPSRAAAAASGVSEGALQVALNSRHAQETGVLQARLNVHRGRLVELEAVRARDLIDVSPQVLAEIEQLQTQIAHLRELLNQVPA
jgi:hypothetical protein